MSFGSRWSSLSQAFAGQSGYKAGVIVAGIGIQYQAELLVMTVRDNHWALLDRRYGGIQPMTQRVLAGR